MRTYIVFSAIAVALLSCGGGDDKSTTGQSTPPPQGQHQLTVIVQGKGRVTSAPSRIDCDSTGVSQGFSTCGGDFADGTSVALSATAASGFAFESWGGACSGTGGCTISISRDAQVYANFVAQGPPPPQGQHRLTVIVQGKGRVTSAPSRIDCDSSTCGGDFADGTSVALSPTAASGFAFEGWGGACSGPGGCTISISRDAQVYANFVVQGPPPPPTFTCQFGTETLSGSWHFRFVETAGNCGLGTWENTATVGPDFVTFGTDCRRNAVFVSADRCHLETDYTCFRATVAYRIVGIYDQHSASSITGTEAWFAQDNRGSTCRSNVAVAATRVQ